MRHQVKEACDHINSIWNSFKLVLVHLVDLPGQKEIGHKNIKPQIRQILQHKLYLIYPLFTCKKIFVILGYYGMNNSHEEVTLTIH